jgi:hypothetical protein
MVLVKDGDQFYKSFEKLRSITQSQRRTEHTTKRRRDKCKLVEGKIGEEEEEDVSSS